jgi:hypothetical protein
MRRGRLLVVVGGLLSGGTIICSVPYWYSQARALFGHLGSQAPILPASSPEEDRALLEQRVKEYWQARVEDNASVTFRYEHPVQQTSIGEQTYKRRIGSAVAMKEFAILDIKLSPERDMADVRIKAKYSYRFNIPRAKPFIVPTEFTDYWQKDAGMWYHVLDTLIIPNGRPVISKKATSTGSSPDGDRP